MSASKPPRRSADDEMRSLLRAEDEERKNYSKPCMACGGLPTVGDEEMCGPCFFGDADTAGGNW